MFRWARWLHAYLSAFAFLALIFFAVTGVVLNHPEWIKTHPHDSESEVTLPKAEVAAALAAPKPDAALAALVRKRMPLPGAFHSGDLTAHEAILRTEGPKGSSDIDVDLDTGHAHVARQPAGVWAVLGDLHRGKNAGGPWRAVIDIAGIVVGLLSLVGYVLFFSLRFRLRTSLILTAASLALMAGVVAFLVP